MNPSVALRRAMLSAALVALAQAASAQTAPKPPPRLPPNASEASRIPAGVDTGSPGTTGSLELGTPVPPTLGADRGELKNKSAAARAAARPKPAASSADCPRRDSAAEAAATGKAPSSAPARSVGAASAVRPSPLARGSTPIDC